MSNPWFRMYSEFSHDPKVQMMTEAMQRRYIMIMCLRCSNCLVTLHETEIAFHLRISADEMAETKALFISKGFIDYEWNLLNWEKRQFASDTSKERVARYRALQKEKQEPQCNVTETLPKQKSNAIDTEQNRTDTDTDKRKSAVATPDGVNDVLWQDFKKLRSQKKAPITQTALDGIRREAAKAGVSLPEALKTCCERGWAGFKAEWMAERANGFAPVQTVTVPSKPGIDPTLAGLIAEKMSGAVKPPSADMRAELARLSGRRVSASMQ